MTATLGADRRGPAPGCRAHRQAVPGARSIVATMQLARGLPYGDQAARGTGTEEGHALRLTSDTRAPHLHADALPAADRWCAAGELSPATRCSCRTPPCCQLGPVTLIRRIGAGTRATSWAAGGRRHGAEDRASFPSGPPAVGNSDIDVSGPHSSWPRHSTPRAASITARISRGWHQARGRW